MKDMALNGTERFEDQAQQEESTETAYSYGTSVPKIFGLFTAVAAIGWAVSVFLTGIHFWALPLPASFDPTGTPWQVMTSEYAYIMGIPLALLGAVYYLTVLLMSGLWFQTRAPLILKLLTPVTIIGVMSSAVFVYLQLFVIEAICPFCMVSAASTTVLLLLEYIMIKKSSLPSLTKLIPTAKTTFNKKGVTWMGLMFVAAALPILVFWITTIMPFPGS
ncbi:vitamin K epoxide reductase family protein [Salisediminibacterium selenitireducens]|uniref:Vitamin K epoxide reductase n=1 Tax=Bacillus selenitireducens (strain ATCC 700615 / DSM 15326 / MLS10) TaxID=439292 RepID=D6XXN5_BACIE|nr:vitamin K epoxide reductase family protein [Salisediminibacterium selenitireducens]ADI00078.1 Vitamin K epoxide reductase [[Bacillus] selenitireducens MLS10]